MQKFMLQVIAEGTSDVIGQVNILTARNRESGNMEIGGFRRREYSNKINREWRVNR